MEVAARVRRWQRHSSQIWREAVVSQIRRSSGGSALVEEKAATLLGEMVAVVLIHEARV
jgi:hypothetical protein